MSFEDANHSLTEHVRPQLEQENAEVSDDHGFCNPDPEEQEPEPVKAKPIVSVNGEDVDRKAA
jgi:hypothetical protein